ncbi:MAG: NBR1-Ig-like domain-containing protein, partial [Anaerolineales bacterium]
MHKLFRMGTGSIVLALLLLTGCNLPSRVNPPASELALTMAAETIEAQMTLNAQALPTSGAAPTATTDPLLTENPQFTIAPTNTPGPSLTPTEEPCDAAGFDKDVTVPDGTEMTPGEEFTKTWRVINEGTCTWNSGYSLVFDDGDAMGAPASIQITSGTVSRGTKLDISIDLTAPSTP